MGSEDLVFLESVPLSECLRVVPDQVLQGFLADVPSRSGALPSRFSSVIDALRLLES